MEKLILIPILSAFLGANIFVNPAALVSNHLQDKRVVAFENGENTPYLLPTTETNYFPIRDWNVLNPPLGVRSAILYDSGADKVLFSLYPKDRLPVASLTKLMTAVAVIENMHLDDVVEVKDSAIKRSEEEGGGSDLVAGEKVRAADLLKLMLIESSNDAAYVLDEHLAEAYGIDLVEKMNQKAAELEMFSTFFTEAAGLDDKNSFSTSRDLVELVKYSFRYGFLYDILKTPQAEIASIDGRFRRQVLNTNKLLGVLLNVVGGKTGYTDLAGGSMILITKSPTDESNLISVVLGSNDRFGDTETLVKWSRNAFIWK